MGMVQQSDADKLAAQRAAIAAQNAPQQPTMASPAVDVPAPQDNATAATTDDSATPPTRSGRVSSKLLQTLGGVGKSIVGKEDGQYHVGPLWLTGSPEWHARAQEAQMGPQLTQQQLAQEKSKSSLLGTQAKYAEPMSQLDIGTQKTNLMDAIAQRINPDTPQSDIANSLRAVGFPENEILSATSDVQNRAQHYWTLGRIQREQQTNLEILKGQSQIEAAAKRGEVAAGIHAKSAENIANINAAAGYGKALVGGTTKQNVEDTKQKGEYSRALLRAMSDPYMSPEQKQAVLDAYNHLYGNSSASDTSGQPNETPTSSTNPIPTPADIGATVEQIDAERAARKARAAKAGK